MSTVDRSKTMEIAAVLIGALAIAASAYFIFLTEGNAFRMTNWVISLAFVVFIVYNFVNAKLLKKSLNELRSKNIALSEKLSVTSNELAQAASDMEQIKRDLIKTQRKLNQSEKKLKEISEE
jgi:uncharacterized protein YoxC